MPLRLAATSSALLALAASRLTGVTTDEDGATFDDRYSPDLAKLALDVASATHGGGALQLGARFESVGQVVKPTALDLELINRHSHVTLDASNVVVVVDYAANDALMRRPLRFTKRALQKMAADFNEGRAYMLDHNTGDSFFGSSSDPIGFTFTADVVEETVRGLKANWLRVRSYMPTVDASPERLQKIADVRTGVRRFCSVTVAHGEARYVEPPKDAATGDDFAFFELDDNPDAPPFRRLEGYELSRVYLGAVRAAGDSRDGRREPRAERKSQSTERPAVEPTDRSSTSTTAHRAPVAVIL